mgnify:CR=1 FL=1
MMVTTHQDLPFGGSPSSPRTEAMLLRGKQVIFFKVRRQLLRITLSRTLDAAGRQETGL